MSCQRFHEAIAGYAAGADISGAAATHLVSCESCRARVDEGRRILADVDEELARTLGISATPEFAARAASRAAAASRQSLVWRPAAAWVGLGAAAAIAIASYVREPATPAQRDTPSGSAAALPAPTPPPPVTATAPRSAVSGQAAARRRSQPGSSHPMVTVRRVEEPPVIVDPGQARAIARLRELLTVGRLNEKMLPPEQPREAAELTVVPLEVPEIKVPDVEFVGRPPGSALEQEPKER